MMIIFSNKEIANILIGAIIVSVAIIVGVQWLRRQNNGHASTMKLIRKQRTEFKKAIRKRRDLKSTIKR
ncbi:MAG: hypothetical protein ABIN01_19890 [Ferruginibacter sp.]